MRFAGFSLPCLIVVPVLLGPGVAAATAAESKVKVLIVTGFDVGAHRWRDTTPQTRAILEKTGRFDVKVSEDIGIFESSSLGNYDVVVLNYGFWTAPDPSPEGKAGLLNYVRSGKGLVALHFACSSFQGWDAYHELLGRWWKQRVGGHGPRGTFKVDIKDGNHPITKGLSGFEADDELYAKLSGNAEIHVLASAYSDWSNKVEPIVYVKPFGRGRVVHNLLGHDAKARENKAFHTLVVRGVEWAATGRVSGE